jgi:hypothetical protein
MPRISDKPWPKKKKTAAPKAAKAPAKRGPGRPPKTDHVACLACTRNASAKGLCPSHYRKARRLEFTGSKLTKTQIKRLSQDGRTLRSA